MDGQVGHIDWDACETCKYCDSKGECTKGVSSWDFYIDDDMVYCHTYQEGEYEPTVAEGHCRKAPDKELVYGEECYYEYDFCTTKDCLHFVPNINPSQTRMNIHAASH